MKKGRLYIGTSGWSYEHWKGTFYRKDLKDGAQFNEYSKIFKTVEINNSFYRLPTHHTFTHWKENSPKGFVFSVKASRFITHMKKLDLTKAGMKKFFTRVTRLGNKLGPILFQLPPTWNINVERLSKFLSRLPEKKPYAFEFRNRSWYHNDIYNLLQKYNCAFCIYELAGHVSPFEVTANFVYVRLHGPGGKYQGSYSDEQLNVWATRCIEWSRSGKDVYVYFDNDQLGYAAFNAGKLNAIVDDIISRGARSE